MANSFVGDDDQKKDVFITSSQLTSSLLPQSISELSGRVNGLASNIGANIESPSLDSLKSITSPVNSISQSLNRHGALGDSVFAVSTDGRLEPYHNSMTSLNARYMVESESEREARESREELEKHVRDLQNKMATKEGLDDMKAGLDAIKTLVARRDEKNEPEGILTRLPTLLHDLARHNRASELEVLADFFSGGKMFYWKCCFGHEIDDVMSVAQLKGILEQQKLGRIKKCKKHSHKSFLLVADGYLMSVSVEDLRDGKIKGAGRRDGLHRVVAPNRSANV